MFTIVDDKYSTYLHLYVECLELIELLLARVNTTDDPISYEEHRDKMRIRERGPYEIEEPMEPKRVTFAL